MKLRPTALLCAFLFACSPAAEDEGGEVEAVDAEPSGSASFRVRNAEIRADMIRMLDEAGIEYAVEGDSIVYNLIDGEAIDKIGNEAISEYITRN